MTIFLNELNRGNIAGINEAVLNRAYQVMANPNDQRREHVRVALTELYLHLLQDPNRVRAAEIQQLGGRVNDLVNAKDVLERNYKNLNAHDQELQAQVNAQALQIAQAAQQLLAEKKRLQVYDLEYCQKKIASLNKKWWSHQACVGVFFPVAIVYGVNKVKQERWQIEREIKQWQRVDSLIREKWLSLDEAKKQAQAAAA